MNGPCASKNIRLRMLEAEESNWWRHDDWVRCADEKSWNCLGFAIAKQRVAFVSKWPIPSMASFKERRAVPKVLNWTWIEWLFVSVKCWLPMTPQKFGMTLTIALLGFGLTMIVLCAATHGEVPKPFCCAFLIFKWMKILCLHKSYPSVAISLTGAGVC